MGEYMGIPIEPPKHISKSVTTTVVHLQLPVIILYFWTNHWKWNHQQTHVCIYICKESKKNKNKKKTLIPVE